jgi:type VI secretion system protein ImpK
MRPEIANLVHPVITFGLHLKDRLERGEQLVLETEQAVLKGLLLTDVEAKRWIDFGGETGQDRASHPEGQPVEPGRGRAEYFLGVRYALVCWLDEMFILDSPWESQWNERKLEAALYGTNDRAWRFWVQAVRAEARPGSDALEVFFLCVMLGFSGELRDETEKLQSWISSTQSRILRSQRQPWTYPPELDPPINVPPLHGHERLQQMVLVAGAVLLALMPIVAFVVVGQLGS